MLNKMMYNMLRFVIMKIIFFFLFYKRNAGIFLCCNATFDVTSVEWRKRLWRSRFGYYTQLVGWTNMAIVNGKAASSRELYLKKIDTQLYTTHLGKQIHVWNGFLLSFFLCPLLHLLHFWVFNPCFILVSFFRFECPLLQMVAYFS